MKKRFICTLVMVMVLCSMSLVYAGSGGLTLEGGIIQPYFSNVVAISYNLTFSGSTAKQTVEVEPVSSSSLDYITVSAELLRNGTVVKTWSQRVNKEDTTVVGTFCAYKEQTVSGSGTYQLHAVTKCYKNGVVVDQVDEYSGKVVR
ncbi:MAG: hypothetical protein PHG06_13535 [Parabacteroides sp.]|nr:hypothetical protein [Parabacteroides sp.]